MADNPFPDFDLTTATFEGRTKPVFRMGSGPGVVVIAELPGITPEVAEFARTVADRGFTVAVPSLFGTPGRSTTLASTLSSLTRACVSREFVAFGRGSTSPVTTWLRALAADLHDSCGGPGVGVIGMCFTGGFALAMMVDPVVVAPVLSQPSLPLALTARHRRDLGLNPEDLEQAKERAAGGCEILGLRFTDDSLSPPDRFARLREEFGDAFIGVEIDSSPDNEFGIDGKAHSVVTNDLVDEPGHPTADALEQVLAFFEERLVEP